MCRCQRLVHDFGAGFVEWPSELPSADVINVINMPSFQYFLYLQEQKKSLGLDPVNRQGVPT
jgi:hypothetical protein